MAYIHTMHPCAMLCHRTHPISYSKPIGIIDTISIPATLQTLCLHIGYMQPDKLGYLYATCLVHPVYVRELAWVLTLMFA